MPRTVEVACGFRLILTVDRDSRPTLKEDFFFFFFLHVLEDKESLSLFVLKHFRSSKNIKELKWLSQRSKATASFFHKSSDSLRRKVVF